MSASPPVDQNLVEQAVLWAREAGELTLSHFRSATLRVEHKSDGSPVTMADREAEALLRRRIAEAHPDDAIRGEEHDDTAGSSGRTWVIDPIDGTKAFSRGVGTFSNLLHLDDGHGPAVGVINLPALGETVWAGRGRGCFANGRPVHLSQTRGHDAGADSGLEGRVLCLSGFHEFSPTMFGRATAAGVELRTWGDAYGYALVATGRADAMFDPLMEWWDLAAVAVVVSEAGGVITRRDGARTIDQPERDGPYGFSAIASSGSHDEWVDLLRAD